MPRITAVTGALALALVSALALSSCSGAAPSPADADAAQERTLTVYSGRDEELVAPLIEQFEESSGIDVEVRYAGSTELAAQILEEGERTPAQVFLSQDSGSLGALDAAGLLATLPTGITSAVPAEYTSTDGSWVGLTGRARVIAYDSQSYTAEEIPADVWELTKPEWNGKVAVAPSNASFQAFVTAMRVAEGEDRASEWVEAMVANGVQRYAKNGEILEAVNTGAVPLGLINHYYWARSEQDPTTLRAQLKFGEPGSVSALVNVTGAGILAGSSESSAAREFVEFLVSTPAQEYFATETFEYPLVDGVAAPAGVPALDELGGVDIDLAQLSSVQQTVDLLTATGLL
ncbi:MULTISPECIES: iron ABC transporter substrate-binding protein [Microbacterium]|uniref:iron ABC transporter substrate-binding protein n=1 Tax=Microbacterium TaxID=33882 RepID=UPI0027836C27|nr:MULTISPECIES: iron ABC transporter substrate-binding protein [Microbacterium]MDQ1083951.1 iron(III) transport system substrate-binding protein [Microbacterium sp. SORGH_AS_0344]MDQ1170770.1 iron(III) transport system substrate-binding protein [Microbacterium proteolyticum]